MQAPTHLRRKKRAAQWIPWHGCGLWLRLSSPMKCQVVSVSEWLHGLGYSHAGREMATVKSGSQTEPPWCTCDPTGTVTFPNGVWAHPDLTQIHARHTGCQTYCLSNTVSFSLHVPKAGKQSDPSLLFISNIVLYYVQFSNGCRF